MGKRKVRSDKSNNKKGLKKIRISRPPILPRPASPDAIERKEGYRRQTARIAEAALAYYNMKHHTDYKLVDPRDSYPILDSDGHWMHANFTAKPGAALGGGNGDSSIKLFFAEGKYMMEADNYLVTACCILDGLLSINKCEDCPDDASISHPTGGFCKGVYSAQPSGVRPRLKSKVVKI